jgi:hypothetical protein
VSALVPLDVLIATDFRFPGGTTASIAEEITALARAGYRVGLTQVFGTLVANPRPFAPPILDRLARREAQLVQAADRVVTRLAVLRHPAVFRTPPKPFPAVDAEHVVLVANQAVATAAGTSFYDVAGVDSVVSELMGKRPLWAPIGPLVRSGLTGTGINLRDSDWVNVIDVDEWAVDRPGPRGPVPVIGRHSRAQRGKWPVTKDAILGAYPADGSVEVHILGGADPAKVVLGKVPPQWHVLPFGAQHPRDFLADVDFVVYYQDPDWYEAFGRTVLEGLASGAVAITDPMLRPTFGEAAVYATPAEVGETLRSLHADPNAWRKQAERGQAWVRRDYGHDSQVRRVAEVIGPPVTGRVTTRPWLGQPPQKRRRILCVSSNGAGMGHLTRLLAMARRADPSVQPIFLSVSSAVPVIRREGFPYEYFPSRGALEVSTADWNPLFEQRMRQALRVHRPAAVVFDGTWPYKGLLSAREEAPDALFVWSRRGMWREGTHAEHLGLSSRFDLIIEPGEFAAPADRGPTAGRDDAIRVRPITLLDDTDLLPRDEAAKELGLDPTRLAALVTLGAGNINDISTELNSITAALLEVPDLQVVTTRPTIARTAARSTDRVHQVSYYPLSRCFNAIDLAFAAAGYNSFHEQIAFAVPTAFVPNVLTQTDDQDARARHAGETGTGVYLPQAEGPALAEAVARLTDPDARALVADRCRQLYPGNGAGEAIAHVQHLIGVRGET